MSNESRILDIMEDNDLGRDAEPEVALRSLYNVLENSGCDAGDYADIDRSLLVLFTAIADHVAGN